jgi:hypothetical protein
MTLPIKVLAIALASTVAVVFAGAPYFTVRALAREHPAVRQSTGHSSLSRESCIDWVRLFSDSASVAARAIISRSHVTQRRCADRRAGRSGYWLPDPSELGGPPVVVVKAAEDGGFLDRSADGR